VQPARPLSIPRSSGAQSSGALPSSELSPKELYGSHFSFVWRNLRRLGVSDIQLEDAAQDVFLVVHRRWDSYDARWSSVQTWLFGIVLRVSRDYRRSAWRRFFRFDPDTTAEEAMMRACASGTLPDDAADARQAQALLQPVLEQLNEKKRAVFLMVDIEQMTVPEAAQVLAINPNTAYWRLKSAREEFQRALSRSRARERIGETV
jgi:RNA polymerase sigma-70 factor (ECF subfamily)